MSKIVVTYKDADLDCVASAYAYAEYLSKTDIKTPYYISGLVQEEVNIVCNLFNISLNNTIKEISDEDIIVVDTNSLSSVDYVEPKKIVEFIDHHPDSGDIKFCENAVLRLYEVGAVCTVIAEMFEKNNIDISKESAILLYYGIISNTINLKSKVTTKRDVDMMNWLKQQCHEIDENLVGKIFEEKSKIDIQHLRRIMEIEEVFRLNNDEMIIGQLETTNAMEFFNQYKNNIDRVIREVYDDYHIKYVFINIIDILNGYHFIYSSDKASILYLEQKFNVKFVNGIYKENLIVLRKEIKKYLKDCIER